MKVSYRASKKFSVEAEGENHKQVFEKLAALAEVFGIERCGKCNSEDIIPIVRTAEDKKKKTHTYYELRCKNCYAKFAFGQHLQGGTLFPQRKDGEGNYKPDGGWVVFKRAEDEE